MHVQAYNENRMKCNLPWLESVFLKLGDEFEIRVKWDGETAVMTGVMAVVGGLLGRYVGGRLSTALGAAIGGAAGFTAARYISLREAWAQMKEKLQDVLYLIYGYLQKLDVRDYMRAFDILMSCANSRRELVLNIVEFIAQQLSKAVLCNISNNGHAVCAIGSSLNNY